MDPLSDVLSLLKLQSYISGGFAFSGGLAVQFPKHSGVKCYAILAGRCWLAMEDAAESVLLEAGDCFLLPRGLPFRLTTDLSIPPIEYHALVSAGMLGGAPIDHEGPGTFIAGGHFVLSGDPAGMLLNLLPPIVHIRKESDKAAMRWSLERLREELRDGQPGGSLIAQHLAYMMLIQALRLHLAEGPRSGVGWLFALADKQMGAAITYMHESPGHHWSVKELAGRVGMSRSMFALKFKGAVGEGPMEYLTRWRMLLAGDRLRNSDDSISQIALSLGYESESAFGKAFRRVMGCSPRQHNRQSRSSAATRVKTGVVATV